MSAIYERKWGGISYVPHCWNCDDRTTDKRCGKCFRTVYCSKECQTEDWKHGDHKMKCKTYVEIKQQQEASQKYLEDNKEYHDRLLNKIFEDQSKLSPEQLKKAAKAVLKEFESYSAPEEMLLWPIKPRT